MSILRSRGGTKTEGTAKFRLPLVKKSALDMESTYFKSIHGVEAINKEMEVIS